MNSRILKMRFWLQAVLVAAMAAGPLHAKVLTKFNMDEFESADYDGDDCISAEEFRNLGGLLFHAWDVNGDNLLSGAELFGGPAGNQSVTTFSVDLVSYQRELMRSHEIADKDENGCLSRAEWGKKE